MLTLEYDELLNTRDTGWLLKFDQKVVFLPSSQCSIYEGHNEIEVPLWLAINEGLEGYEI